jgi:translocator assembly and maintenance protein 41
MTITANIPQKLLKQLIEIFPKRISYAFGYGSGVFTQKIVKDENKSSDNSSKNMIDLILAVEDSIEWHEKNLIKNRSHYSLIGWLGPKWISTIQEGFGAKVYFNTLIPIDNYLIKYGVINTKHLINDCLDWDTLYVSGRLHKPVSVLKEPNSSDLSNALKINLQSAVHSALVILPESFTEEQLYLTIAGLSYSGDFRMTFGEDKHKVLKIVRSQINNFRNIYQPLITSDNMSQIVSWNPNSKVYYQDCSPNVTLYHLNLLPKTVQHYLYLEWHKSDGLSDIDDVMQILAHDFGTKTYVRTAIERIVQKSSWSQSFKGIFTAGLSKSVRYGSKKITKMFKSTHLNKS